MEKVLAGKDSNANKIFQTEARIVLAMAQHRQGKLSEARRPWQPRSVLTTGINTWS